MAKYIGIDYGSKRVGVAVSDDSGAMAFPDKVVATAQIREYVLETLNTKQFEAVVIGRSLDYKRNPNPIDEHAQRFARFLEEEGITVFFEDETLTSAQAVHLQGREAGNDASAATLILQSFLDKRRNKVS